jgi:hypothetical protein
MERPDDDDHSGKDGVGCSAVPSLVFFTASAYCRGSLFFTLKRRIVMYAHLFSALKIAAVTLKNRVVMVPLYLAYGHEDGTVSNLLLEHYRLMAQSGVAMVVVESATIDYPAGIGAGRMLRVDTDAQLEGLRQLAETIRQEGAVRLPTDQSRWAFCPCAGACGPFCGRNLRQNAQGIEHSGNQNPDQPVCRGCLAGEKRWFRHGGAARSHWLSVGPVYLAKN